MFVVKKLHFSHFSRENSWFPNVSRSRFRLVFLTSISIVEWIECWFLPVPKIDASENCNLWKFHFHLQSGQNEHSNRWREREKKRDIYDGILASWTIFRLQVIIVIGIISKSHIETRVSLSVFNSHSHVLNGPFGMVRTPAIIIIEIKRKTQKIGS